MDKVFLMQFILQTHKVDVRFVLNLLKTKYSRVKLKLTVWGVLYLSQNQFPGR